MKATSFVFLIVGHGLLAGGPDWYHNQVRLPQSWPRVEAVVTSSQVINPRNPGQYKPEIVFQLADGTGRQVAVRPSWDSSSYTLVKGHVDRYPAGSHLDVAVNPADRNDVRYELGPTLTNMIGPVVLGTMGLLFSSVGAWTLIRKGATRPPSAEHDARLMGRVVWLFRAIGVGVCALAAYLAWLDVSMLRTWVATDAEVVSARSVTSSSSPRRGAPTTMYDVQVTFRYDVGGVRYERQTTSGISSSSTGRRDALLRQYAPGTRHRIHRRPDDPNVIRYNFGWSVSTFALPGGLMLMGLVFLGFSWLFGRNRRGSTS